MAIDWSKPLETNELHPRPVRAHGPVSGGAIDYVAVTLGGGGDWGSRYRHPPGEYSAGKVSGLIRGDLAVRNIVSI